MNDKSYIILSLPRTGSTYLLHSVLGPYLRTKYPNQYYIYDEPFGLDIYKSTGNETQPTVFAEGTFNQQDRMKISLCTIQQEGKLIAGKFFAMLDHCGEIPNIIHDYIKTCNIICLERDDILDQILSYVIATTFDAWNSRGTIPKYSTYVVTRDMFDNVLARRDFYNKFKETVDVVTTIKYEDIATTPDVELLQQMGCTDHTLHPPQIQKHIKLISKKQKLRLLINYNEVMDWCDDEGIDY